VVRDGVGSLKCTNQRWICTAWSTPDSFFRLEDSPWWERSSPWVLSEIVREFFAIGSWFCRSGYRKSWARAESKLTAPDARRSTCLARNIWILTAPTSAHRSRTFCLRHTRTCTPKTVHWRTCRRSTASKFSLKRAQRTNSNTIIADSLWTRKKSTRLLKTKSPGWPSPSLNNTPA